VVLGAARARDARGGGGVLVLGIDPSLSATGLALVDTDGPRLLAFDTVTTNARQSRIQQLERIYACVAGFVGRNDRYEFIDLLACESGLVNGKMWRAALAVAEARAVVLLAASRNCRATMLSMVQNSTAKKAVCGSGAVKKPAVTAAMRDLFGNQALTADECDACAVALAAGGYAVPATTKTRAPRTRAAKKENERC